MNVTVCNTTFNAPGACTSHRRRVLVTPKAMSENGVSARKKTTVHKLVDYFGAITVPGMYMCQHNCIYVKIEESPWFREFAYRVNFLIIERQCRLLRRAFS